MTTKTYLKEKYAKITSKESKENFKKGMTEAGNILKKIGASVGKARNNYLESDREQGGGLGLFR
jgi:hypothetical protein